MVTQGDVKVEEFVAAGVAPFKKVRQVEFVAEMNRSSGKIPRKDR